MELTSRGRWIGPLFAVVGVFGFSVKAILIKLAYAWYPIDALTLLTLRMLFSAPFFIAMAWWSSRPPRARVLTRADWKIFVALGFIGYYLASLLDFMGLAYITAALERLVLFLYPTMVVVLSALVLRKPITRTDRTGAGPLLRRHRHRVRARSLGLGATPRRCGRAARSCSRAPSCTRCTSSAQAA